MFNNFIKSRWPNIDDVTGKGNGHETPTERKRFETESELDDKITVRKHLQPLIGKESLPKVYYTGPVEECDFRLIPLPFVIKTRCQSGNTKIISSLNDLESIIKFYKNQWSYRGRNNNVIIEEVCDIQNSILFKDFKYHYELITFGGKVTNILYQIDIPPEQKIVLPYYPNWTRNMLYPNNVMAINGEVPRPNNLENIINFAEKCAKFYINYTSIPHVRISVYVLKNNKLVFGEFTGATCGGLGPEEYQSKMGLWWKESAPNIWL